MKEIGEDEEIDESTFAPFRMIFNKRMMQIEPFIFLRALSAVNTSGVYIGFWVYLINQTKDDQGVFLKDTLSKDQITSRAILTYTSLGIGMVLGPIPMGLLQDKYGPKAALSYILAICVVSMLLLIVQNELKFFNFWFASFTMIGLGAIDNITMSYLTLLLGFEFKSKIVPAGTRVFLESFGVFLGLASFSLWPLVTIN